jgi:hypothetical protein
VGASKNTMSFERPIAESPLYVSEKSADLVEISTSLIGV